MRYFTAGAFLLVLCGWADSQPVMSRGQQTLAIGYDDCLRRAQGAFAAEGWVNVGTNGNAVSGFKGMNGAYIVCNPAPDAKLAVNIFVASNANDSGVPGLERQKLQARMEWTGSPRSPQTPTPAQSLRTSCWRWEVEMKDGRRAEATMIMTSDGVARFDRWPTRGKWTVQGSQYIFDWDRGPDKKDVMMLNGNVLSGSNYETNWIRGTLINCS